MHGCSHEPQLLKERPIDNDLIVGHAVESVPGYLLQGRLLAAIQPVQFILELPRFLNLHLLDLLWTQTLLDFLNGYGSVDLACFARMVGLLFS